MEDLPVKKVSVEQMVASEAGQEVITQAPVSVAAAGEKAVDQPAVNQPLVEPRRAAPASQSLGDLLGRLEDPSRITRIEKIAAANGRLFVEIKDSDGRALRSLDITLRPETKKVTIILDVKN